MAILPTGAARPHLPLSVPDALASSPAAPRPLPVRLLALFYRWLGISLAVFSAYFTLELFQVEDSLELQVVAVAVALLAGALGAVVWTAREEKVDSARIQHGLEVVLRFVLGYIFIGYGMAKIYGSQFHPPTLFQLHRPVGSLPGIQLTWLFFGYSYAYALFIALSQIGCSLLLFFRRTQLLGAVLLLPIIGNIVFINFTHQIPVKLTSCVYLVMTVYLVLADAGRLKALFWDNAPAPPRGFPALSPRFRWARHVGKAAFIVGCFAYSAWMFDRMMAPVAPVVTPLYGAWRVVEIDPPGALLAGGPPPGMPPSIGGKAKTEYEESPWTRVYFEKQFQGKQGVVEFGAEGFGGMSYEVDAARRRLTIRSLRGHFEPFEGTYELAGDRLVLNGRLGSTPVRATLEKMTIRYPH